MSSSKSKSVPLYGIEIFSRKEGKRQYEVEVFDSNRHFEVHYPHRHDFFEILFLTNGHGMHTIDFKDYTIKPNSIFFLSPGQIHSISLSKDIYGYIFLFSPEFFLINKTDKNKIFEFPFFYNTSDENPPLELSNANDIEFLKQLFVKGCEENIAHAPDSEEIIHAILDLILMYCKKLYPQQSGGSGMKKGRLMVKKFKQLIEERYKENFSVKDYAELLSVTPNHLNETVKNVMGRTASDLIEEKMIIEIKKLLLHTDLTATEVADTLNFSDQSYFSKFFKKHVGMAPGEFRADKK
ncbi:MAG TPA: helix-turn-helix transcriptional regulator [Cytophagaceae bacterium]|nr:helix-turn-helix transcriptional regulator [Cytophagaceae bacterium]